MRGVRHCVNRSDFKVRTPLDKLLTEATSDSEVRNVAIQGDLEPKIQVDLACLDQEISHAPVVFPNLAATGSNFTHYSIPKRIPFKGTRTSPLTRPIALSKKLASWMPPPPARHLKPLASTACSPMRIRQAGEAALQQKFWLFRARKVKSVCL